MARHVMANTEDVGTQFAEEARKIHYGEREERSIRGQATREETEALLEEGIDMSAEQPKILTDAAVQDSDVVITMGCGDTCKFYSGKRYEDWVLDDPAGQGVDSVRPIRDEIRRRVEVLIGELLPADV